MKMLMGEYIPYIFFGAWFFVPILLSLLAVKMDWFYSTECVIIFLSWSVASLFGVFLYCVIPECGLFTAFWGGNLCALVLLYLNNR